ncbi:MAG: DUF2157 domain-containing protein [Gammaproteobacteria bacterium]|nr:DUF2157 domain-containing protein [Gammaproteobacteria bacterium]
MNNKQFYKKLLEQIPYWQTQGWLDQQAAQSILQDAHTAIHKSHKLSLILGVMGVLLLAAGAISFFAANWQGMSKLLKLGLLFSSMTGAYLACAYYLSEPFPGRQRHPELGQAFLLLGVILFGTNIMLIAQIYHIDSHYPNGVFFWAAGALMTAIIMRSETVMIAATLLALLWSGSEIFDFRQIHWPYLFFWFISVLFVIRQGFHLASHFIILSLFCWSLFSFTTFIRYASEGFIVQIYLLIGIAIFMLSRTLKAWQYWPGFAENMSRYALVFALIFIYVLSFPGLDLYPSLSHSTMDQVTWMLINLVLMILISVLLMGRLKRIHGPLLLYKLMGIIWLGILFATLLMNVFLYQDQQGITVIMVNLLLFSLVVWLIYTGLAEHKRFYVNSAFVIFTITLISRYFDTFWSLMNRSLFFITGGLILIIGGYWLEKKRRQLGKRLRQQSAQTNNHHSEQQEDNHV